MFEGLAQAVHTQVFFIAVVYVLVVFLVGLDLWAGIRKAKQRGEFRSSYGLRKTIDKLCRYLNLMLVLTIIDCMQMLALYQLAAQGSIHLPQLAVLTFAGGMFIGIIEVKSIWENNSQKERARIDDALKLVAKMAKDRDIQDVLNNLVTYLKIEKNEADNSQN